MEFELKIFFNDPPRIREEVKTHVHQLAGLFVDRVADHVQYLQIDRILPRHVRLIITQMVQDPLTRMNRNGLCVQQTKVKNMAKVFQRALDKVEENLQVDARYGGIDKKVVKGTQSCLDKLNIRYSTGASVCIASCVAEVCGIMLNSAQNLIEDRTLSLQAFQTHSTTYCLSTGERCANSSLIRFLHYLRSPICRGGVAESSKKTECGVAHLEKHTPNTNVSEPNKKGRPLCESPNKKQRRLETKTVSFQTTPRPRTPDTCFWEDD